MCKGERVEVVTLDEEALRELLKRVRTGEVLDAGDRQLIEDVLKAYCWLSEHLEAKDVSLAKLHQMLFGVKSERKDAVFPPEKGAGASEGSGEKAGEGKKRSAKGTDGTGCRRIREPNGCRCRTRA